MTVLSRRTLLAGTAGSLSVTSCSRQLGEKPRVSILRAASYTADLFGLLRRALLDHKVQVKDKSVLLKPNLVEFDPGTKINTNPVLVQAALEAFRSLGAAEVRIAEGPGHRRITLDLAEAAGYFQAISNFEDLFTDLNLDDVQLVKFRSPASKLSSLYLPKMALKCDLLVSLPKMKTHHWVGATLSMKNLFGLVPGGVYGWPKNVLHWAGINECVVDLYRAFANHFCIVDGIEGMEGNGPIQGTPKHAGVIVTGPDPVATDATCCRIMGIDPGKIDYLRRASTRGQTEATNVQQIGESIRNVAVPFELIPEFRHLRLAPLL